ncbi:FAD-dependent oxidoreductase [Pseudoalteromonas sp. T1lg22]|uniref:FAD-dependent oxidoreductase n=1 Tax=Pseudoalteromonas sp. T1lg22 TaxID=2077096 RepID=UPI000CF609E1|nr:FAD-dependent oxidoreductase [Pseudoalteromonas sp. T1lg22]
MGKKIAIVGFGLCGRVAALLLAKHYRLEVFDSGDAEGSGSAGPVAAAMLAPLAESVLCEQDLAEQGLESLAIWPQLLALLDTQVHFQRQGTVVVAHPQDQGAMAHFQKQLKPLAGYAPEQLSAARLRQLEPELAGRFGGGLYLPSEGQLDNLGFFHHSYARLKNAGVRFHFHTQVQPQELAQQDYLAVLDCRGMGAKGELPLRGVRGEVARVVAPEVFLQRPVRLMHPRYPIYIAPKPGNRYVIGATEIESQDQRPVTVRSGLELLSAAFSVHSGFAEAHIEALQVGLRPALMDNRPSVSRQGKVISINGLYRHGYMLAPAVVRTALTEFNTAF